MILRDVSAREKALADLRQSQNELLEMSAAAEATREQEKSRIARELHDELGQALTMLRMDVAWCKAKLAGDAANAAAKLDRDGETCSRRRSPPRGGSPPTCGR